MIKQIIGKNLSTFSIYLLFISLSRFFFISVLHTSTCTLFLSMHQYLKKNYISIYIYIHKCICTITYISTSIFYLHISPFVYYICYFFRYTLCIMLALTFMSQFPILFVCLFLFC